VPLGTHRPRDWWWCASPLPARTREDGFASPGWGILRLGGAHEGTGDEFHRVES